MTTTCAFPGCDKPVRPVPRARYCGWEHLTDAQNMRERERVRRKRAANRAAGKPLAPLAAVAAVKAAPLPAAAFADNPRAVRDRGSPGQLPAPMSWALGASSLVAL